MIKEVEGFPWEAQFDSSTTAAILRGYNEGHHDTMDKTQTFYTVHAEDGTLILAAGVAVWSYVRRPELWLILAKPFTQHLRQSLRLTKEVWTVPSERYPNLICEVKRDNAQELHFARYFGWRETDERCIRPGGADYIQFEV